MSVGHPIDRVKLWEAEKERDGYRDCAEQVLTLLESALGKRPASVVEGVGVLIQMVEDYDAKHAQYQAEARRDERAKVFAEIAPVSADVIMDTPARYHATLELLRQTEAEARRQGAEQERERIASRIQLECEALRIDHPDMRYGTSMHKEGREFARAIRAGEWSGEDVDDA